MLNLDPFIVALDRGLRTVFAQAHSARPLPGAELPDAALGDEERSRTAALMRVNHVGEVCAQALYQGQALTARDAGIRKRLEEAAHEETEHLAWCEQRIAELGGRKSLLNPLWYGGALVIGTLAGALGDRWSLGFLAETERQVEKHLEGHMARISPADGRSAAILAQMKADEARHATTAVTCGAAELPLPVRLAMKAAAKVMTTVAYRV